MALRTGDADGGALDEYLDVFAEPRRDLPAVEVRQHPLRILCEPKFNGWIIPELRPSPDECVFTPVRDNEAALMLAEKLCKKVVVGTMNEDRASGSQIFRSL